MKRTTITMDVCGRIAVPSDTANLWMSDINNTNGRVASLCFGQTKTAC